MLSVDYDLAQSTYLCWFSAAGGENNTKKGLMVCKIATVSDLAFCHVGREESESEKAG